MIKQQRLFFVTGSTAILIAGLLSAFSAHTPSEFIMWACAYLILIVGGVQLLIGYVPSKQRSMPSRSLAWAIYLSFNMGSIAVLFGTAIKTVSPIAPYLVGVGGLAVAISLVFCLLSARRLPASLLTTSYVIILGTVLISVPIGLILSTH